LGRKEGNGFPGTTSLAFPGSATKRHSRLRKRRMFQSLPDIQAAKKFGTRKDKQLVHVLHYHEAMLFLRKGHFESAVEALTFLINDGVHSDELNTALGMGALLLLPKDAPASGTSGHEVLLRVGEAERLRSEKKYEESAKAYAELAQQFPDFPDIHYAYGRVLLAMENSEAAIAQFREEIRNNPTNVRARLQVASAYYRVDSRAGIPFAEEAVKLQPKYPFGHYLLGLLYFDTGETVRAIPELETASRLAPQEPQFYFALGNAYAKAGRKQEAARARASFIRLQHREGSESGPNAYGEAHNSDPARPQNSAPQP
jgi:predicted Zn-dependent protease